MEDLNMADDIAQKLNQLIPAPSNEYHKGQMGRICVIGGSLQYTGAAYYAAMSSLKAGADLIYMVCCEGAVPIMKSYSPEIIALPHYLDQKDSVDHIMDWMTRMHVVLIGPGLGLDPLVQENVRSILLKLKQSDRPVPLVIDADGLRLLAQDPYLLRDYAGPVYLTPNIREQEILVRAMYGDETRRRLTSSDASKLGKNVLLVLKGDTDVIQSSTANLSCNARTSWRRCGGQGDMIAGSLATMAHYAQLKKNGSIAGDWEALAGMAACTSVRKANSLAFAHKGRSMLVTDMLDVFPSALSAVFPSWKSWPESTDS